MNFTPLQWEQMRQKAMEEVQYHAARMFPEDSERRKEWETREYFRLIRAMTTKYVP